MVIDVPELLDRMCTLQIEAVASIQGFGGLAVEAFPAWLVASAQTPYWINRIGALTEVEEPGRDSVGDEGSVDQIIVESGLIWGTATEGVGDEAEARLNAVLYPIVRYFRRRILLKTDPSGNYPDGMRWLSYAQLTLGSGLTQFPPIAGGTIRIGSLFRTKCSFIIGTDQAYS